MSNLSIPQTLFLPPSSESSEKNVEIECSPSLVIIGANGAGKTRIGTWLEVKGPDHGRAFRIPAQRSLRFPASISPTGIQSAQENFQFGERPPNWSEDVWNSQKKSRRLNSRYGFEDYNLIASAPINDFQKLLVLLFSENYETLLAFDAQNDATTEKIKSPTSLIKKIKILWESILTHRIIELSSGEVRVRSKEENATSYLATGMSDGERVIFYLIGQCLCAPKQSVIIIDEPELHLHKAIQKRLWDAIETERADCQFVYITHDLAFAEGRTEARKIWLQSSTKESFKWTEIDSLSGIPDALYLEVLGSRQPVLFTEGTHNSIDNDVYCAVYPDFLVQPVGSCSSVLQATKALRDVSSIHHLRPYGMIDRDYLIEGQLVSYRNAGVGTPEVAEIENIFLTPEVLQVMANRLQVENDKISEVRDHVFAEFERNIESHALSLTKRDITLSLGRFAASATSSTELEERFSELATSIDIPSLYNEHLCKSKKIIESKNYEELLKTFNHKGLLNRVSGIFGLTKPNYLERARSLTRKRDTELVSALSKSLPKLEELQ